MRKFMIILLICFTFVLSFGSNLLIVQAYNTNPDLEIGGNIDSGSVTCESIFKKMGSIINYIMRYKMHLLSLNF